MSRRIRENILVGYGNQALYPAGQPVYDTTNTSGVGPSVLVAPGQFVFYDPSTGLSIDTATWTKQTNGRFVFGVGYDGLGHGYSTAIRKAFGELMYGCHIDSVQTDCGACGLPQITDVFMHGCFRVDEPVSIKFRVTDPNSVYEYDYGYGQDFVYTLTVPADICNACNEDFDCTKMVNHLWQQVRPETGRPDRTKSVLTKFPKTPLPFSIVPLYSTSYEFNLTVEDSLCENCAYVQGLTSISINNETVTFTNNKVNTNFTSFGQLELIVNQINKVLDGKGAAVIVHGTGNCCDYKLQINTCLPVGNITGTDSEGDPTTITPTTSNPLAEVTTEADASYLCTNPDGTFTPTCGWRIIGKPFVFTHECFTSLSIPRVLTTKIEVFGGNIEKQFPFYIKEIQKATSPKGLGVTWAIREYKSDNGGTGREHNNYNSKYGTLGLPGMHDVINAVSVDSGVTYDVINIEHSYVDVPLSHIGYMNQLNGTTTVLVPQNDSVTKAALETAWNNYITQGYCNALPEIEFCTA